ncbi:MAG TPA: trimethylamine methyltransferase family protein, partial [Spirochaetota bacterium]|nr:trimethylamine methyltransferase family protein [Spirochaetota bacterium]
MPKELSSSPRFQYEPLTRDDLRKIHANSMQIFSEVGFEVMEPQAFELFKNYGARTDAESHKVFLTEKQVMDIISSVPPRVTLYGRDDRHNCVLGAGNVYYATGGTALNMLDYENNKRRPAQLQDLADVVRLVDKLDNIHVLLLPTYPNELPVDDVDINRFFTGLCYTDKHIMGGVYTAWGIEKVISMAEEIAGGQKALRERPFISMITCGISPLKLDSKYGAYMIQLAKHGIPTAVPVEPLCGATAPITLAGTLVIQNCDGLIHMMLTQLANA